ncbi:MAG: hypothetical protein LBJ94_03105 [Puniceicoccales bacterium]|jgi:hypothetical protein|nr:hypothetical protein [Puniceicoccales bacterium]
MKQGFDDRSDKRLHDLLRIKRLERPDSKRWVKFDRCFERKRLSAMMEKKVSVSERILAIFGSKRFACAMSGLCLVIIATIGIGRSSEYYSLQYACSGSGGDRRLSYVRDDILCNVENVDFRTQFNHISHGVAYVCDSILSKGAFVR